VSGEGRGRAGSTQGKERKLVEVAASPGKLHSCSSAWSTPAGLRRAIGHARAKLDRGAAG
jgi:hypothetical protein